MHELLRCVSVCVVCDFRILSFAIVGVFFWLLQRKFRTQNVIGGGGGGFVKRKIFFFVGGRGGREGGEGQVGVVSKLKR